MNVLVDFHYRGLRDKSLVGCVPAADSFELPARGSSQGLHTTTIAFVSILSIKSSSTINDGKAPVIQEVPSSILFISLIFFFSIYSMSRSTTLLDNKDIAWTLKFIIAMLILSSCSQKEEKLELLFPIDEDLKPVITSFQWDGESSFYNFQLFESEDLIIDSILTQQELQLSKILRPNKTYSWKVSTEATEETATFTTQNTLQLYSGLYDVIAMRSCFGPNPPCDTTFTTQLQIIKDGEDVIAKERITGMGNANTLSLAGGNDHELFYNYTFRPESSVFFNLQSDSILVGYTVGGLGGGISYRFEGSLN